MKNIILLFLLIIASSPVLAGWSGRGNVVEIYSYNGQHFVITTIVDNPCRPSGKF